TTAGRGGPRSAYSAKVKARPAHPACVKELRPTIARIGLSLIFAGRVSLRGRPLPVEQAVTAAGEWERPPAPGVQRSACTVHLTDPEHCSGRLRAHREHGGGRGIRTPDRLAPTPVFKTGAISHSAIPPRIPTPRRVSRRRRAPCA